MIFVDSSFFIAIADQKDQWHEKAKKISIREDIVVSDLVISEVLTEIGRRKGGKVSQKIFYYFIRVLPQFTFQQAFASLLLS